MSIIIHKARIINPAESLDKVGTLQVSEDGVLEAMWFGEDALSLSPSLFASHTVIDFSDGIVASGLFDMHCHFREPGFEYKETIETGVRSALAGGFTGVAVMPNTEPPIDNAAVVAFIKSRAAKLPIDLEVIGAITVGRKGERIAPFGELAEAGVRALSDDGAPVMNSRVMRLAFEYASQFNLLLIQHCEDTALSHGGVMNESLYASLLGLRGIPSIAESIVLSRDLQLLRYLLAQKSGAMPFVPRYHVAHISTKEAVELVRRAKAEGLPVTAEVTPHHFTLSDKDVFESGYDGNFRMNPPLRSEHDRQAILDAIADGTIDAIATDHAPHACHEKECGISQAAFGIVGLETSVGLTFTELVHTGRISAYRAIELLSTAPRRILGLPPLRFEVGKLLNATLIAPSMEWIVEPSQFSSKSKNSPFAHRILRGKAIGIIHKGKVILPSIVMRST
ncbi:MAG: dihydroorotase [Chloroherpetonaceae bacterium]|nr:dihydroorotase [Chloroherpetonaceae bacterium]MDW8020808.1 dihydroorotase [Chloroherpetonaceae bacterium]MDW8466811.1 dihydroorotase [Chloroherpetonaceae bacterium]